MSPRLARSAAPVAHERALELAAARMDAALPAGDAAWLEDHLAACAACASAAAEYEEQRLSLRALRAAALEPPRDLWARTAAAIETEGTPRAWGSRAWGSRARTARGLQLAPVAALAVVAVVVGAGLLNGHDLFPDSTIKGDGPMPTPISVAAAEFQVITRGEDGTVQVLTRRFDQVCPMAAETCGLSSSFDLTTTATMSGSAHLDAIISPDRDRLVVVDRGAGSGGVYVVNMGTPKPSPVPTRTPAPVPTATPAPTPSLAPVTPPATPSEAPATPATGSPDPSASPEPSVSPESTATPSPDATDEPTPSIAVSPSPDGALMIARDVIIVGGIAAYSDDGTRFAFTARPVDGSTGPDVYVWTVGESEARAVTTDHTAVFAGWLDGRLLVSRVVDGGPETVLLDLADGTETPVGTARMWRPVVDPRRETAAWWEGDVTLGDEDVEPALGSGRLVLSPWPAGAPDSQVLATGPLTDWDVHWDAARTVLALWTSDGAPGEAGRLGLYAIDGETGLADLEHPLMAPVPAFAGFSLQPNRLAWAAPADGGDTTVQVVVWSGRDVGRLELPTQQGVTVVR